MMLDLSNYASFFCLTILQSPVRRIIFSNTRSPKVCIEYGAFQQLSKAVCSYHVTYAFQSESTLYSCLNVKELLARNRREI